MKTPLKNTWLRHIRMLINSDQTLQTKLAHQIHFRKAVRQYGTGFACVNQQRPYSDHSYLHQLRI